ncbi:MAG TPA: glycoside hydrolase family 97 protein [Mucilaginibacter sp.]|jgi:alpha-glucosidase|nr:glycoside hydrolase family 97 protein [Mucilaginibacter sp.]
MKRYFLWAILLTISCAAKSADTLSVFSPSGKISVKVWLDKDIKYAVYERGTLILQPSEADILLENGRGFSAGNRIRSSAKQSVSSVIISPVPEKRKKITDNYNILTITFSKPYKVEFRAYDDGVAYRFLTSFKDSIMVQNEVAKFHFLNASAAWFPAVHKRDDADVFHTSYEEQYPLTKLDSIAPGTIGYLPVLVNQSMGPKIAVVESDLEDYPGMFLGGTGSSELDAKFAPYPLEEKMTGGEYPESIVTKRANYIAKTKGARSFPWRVLMIADEDKDLPSNDLVYRLASPSRIGNAAWVKPGKATDEWIVNVNLFNVPFRSGVNTASYKYYIDFAKRFGFDRIMMDAGWSEATDLFKMNPNINMDTLVAYAKKKGIKLSMWTLSYALNRQLDSALDRFNKWGIDFIMTDFIDRDDQKTVNFYHRIAKACADHHIMIMYHGAYPPKGFNRTYPNNITREGVMGSEYNIWSDKVTPMHDVTLPFTRMLAGSFDYEPGILNNATQKSFRTIEGAPMSQGTRCHQLAMFVVYDNPMQIFAGNPSQAWLEPAFTELLGSLPTVWDQTNILDGKVGEYIVTARQNGDNWYVGGMSNWTSREIELKFDFLDDNANYAATISKDGVNADRYPADYLISESTVKKGDLLKIKLAPGGGFLIRLLKK